MKKYSPNPLQPSRRSNNFVQAAIPHTLRRSKRLPRFLAFGLIVIFTSAVGLDQTVRAQEAPSALANALIGHWRNTVIEFESPQDTHLVLHASGACEQWVVTAGSRSDKTTGRWKVDGRTLTLLSEEGEQIFSAPFTMFEGKLVLPNIQGRRVFWEKID